MCISRELEQVQLLEQLDRHQCCQISEVQLRPEEHVDGMKILEEICRHWAVETSFP
jgi:hypothetical protein